MRAVAGDTIIALAYAAAAWVTLRRSRRPGDAEPHDDAGRSGRAWSERSYWRISGITLAIMAVGRVGVAERAREAVRDAAQDSSWYPQRTVPQVVAIVVTTLLVVGVAELGRRRLAVRPPLLHLTAFAGLVGLAAARLISLHHVERVLLVQPLGSLTIAHWSELTLLAVVLISATEGTG